MKFSDIFIIDNNKKGEVCIYKKIKNKAIGFRGSFIFYNVNIWNICINQ